MADNDLSAPFSPSSDRSQPSSDELELIITVHDEHSPNQDSLTQQQSSDTHLEILENPFEFLGLDGFELPEWTTVDSFRNHTLKIEGVYEWVKIVICLPIALARLVLFGLCLLVGYVATKIAPGLER